MALNSSFMIQGGPSISWHSSQKTRGKRGIALPLRKVPKSCMTFLFPSLPPELTEPSSKGSWQMPLGFWVAVCLAKITGGTGSGKQSCLCFWCIRTFGVLLLLIRCFDWQRSTSPPWTPQNRMLLGQVGPRNLFLFRRNGPRPWPLHSPCSFPLLANFTPDSFCFGFLAWFFCFVF